MNETSPPFTESELVNLLSSWANTETSSYLTEQSLSDPEIDLKSVLKTPSFTC